MQPALQNFIQIENIVNIETKRLCPFPDYQGASRKKAQEIWHALDRLYLMVIQKNPGAKNLHKRVITLTEINPEESSEIDLSTINSMLDAHISQWESEIEPSTEQGMEFNGRKAAFRKHLSLREALNISTNNIFNSAGRTWGPLWGKTTALQNVETKLGFSQPL